MECLVDLHIDNDVIFGNNPIKLDDHSGTVTVNLYSAIEEALLGEIEYNGLYETFPDAIDDITEDVEDDNLVENFITYARNKVVSDLQQHKLVIVECRINQFDDFDITVEIDFKQLWEQFNGRSNK